MDVAGSEEGEAESENAAAGDGGEQPAEEGASKDDSGSDDLDHYPLETLEQFRPLSLLNETCRDPKRLMVFLETVKTNFEVI